MMIIKLISNQPAANRSTEIFFPFPPMGRDRKVTRLRNESILSLRFKIMLEWRRNMVVRETMMMRVLLFLFGGVVLQRVFVTDIAIFSNFVNGVELVLAPVEIFGRLNVNFFFFFHILKDGSTFCGSSRKKDLIDCDETFRQF